MYTHADANGAATAGTDGSCGLSALLEIDRTPRTEEE
jgi:hypothetical protein